MAVYIPAAVPRAQLKQWAVLVRDRRRGAAPVEAPAA
jgi:hypothetical protein